MFSRRPASSPLDATVAAASTASSLTTSSASSVGGLRCSSRPPANAPGVHPVPDRSREGASCEHRSKLFRVTVEVADLEMAAALNRDLLGIEAIATQVRATTSATGSFSP